jgi:hypothetical protein
MTSVFLFHRDPLLYMVCFYHMYMLFFLENIGKSDSPGSPRSRNSRERGNFKLRCQLAKYCFYVQHLLLHSDMIHISPTDAACDWIDEGCCDVDNKIGTQLIPGPSLFGQFLIITHVVILVTDLFAGNWPNTHYLWQLLW